MAALALTMAPAVSGIFGNKYRAPPPPPPPAPEYGSGLMLPLLCTLALGIVALVATKAIKLPPWDRWGMWLDVSWLSSYPAGGLPPLDEASLKGKTFLEILDEGVRRIHDAKGGLGVPNSWLAWHWGMVPLYGVLFTLTFLLTTPAVFEPDTPFPYLTLVQKLFVFFNAWEALGLGVEHGPLHGKFNPPFQDWWYRLTPGTIKYAGPFGHWSFLSMQRNYLDCLVEGYRSLRAAGLQPSLDHSLSLPRVCGSSKIHHSHTCARLR